MTKDNEKKADNFKNICFWDAFFKVDDLDKRSQMLLQWDKPDDIAKVEKYDIYFLNGCDAANYED